MLDKRIKEIFDLHVDTLSVPVLVISRKQFYEEYIKLWSKEKREEYNIKDINALYMPEENECGEKEFIFINKELNLCEQLCCLFHEIKHYECTIKECYCIERKIGDIEEYHAIKFELEMGLYYSIKKGIKFTIDLAERCVLKYPSDNCHHIASVRIQKIKLWKKCKKFIEEPS